MERIKRFLSLKRFWHNVWTHFPVPMVICLIIGCGFCSFLSFIIEGKLFAGLIIALTFSTAASCICRRFGVHRMLVTIMTAIGMALGYVSGQSSMTYWLQMISVGVCVIVSCWTRHFYIQLFAVPFWFAVCLAAPLILAIFTITFSTIGGIVFIFAAFVFAPFVFLGGLPFGDEDYTRP